MLDNKPTPFAGDISIARARFRRFAEAAANHLPVEEINSLAGGMAYRLNYHDFPDCLEQWEEEREAESNGTLKPAVDTAGDASFLSFMKSLGVTETDAGPRTARHRAKR